jgi:hypothetical protein
MLLIKKKWEISAEKTILSFFQSAKIDGNQNKDSAVGSSA